MDIFEMRRHSYSAIRSWKDVAALIAAVAAFSLIHFVLPRFFPNFSEKTVNFIAVFAALIMLVIVSLGLNA